MSTSTTTATAVETQNRTCQSATSAIQADSGRPIAPPTPSVALIAATEVDCMAGGVISRRSEMPTGMKPIARPCRARPASIGTRVSERAQTAEPTVRMAAEITRTRCLPNMSARRPVTTIETAAASSVIVTTHAALPGDVERYAGSADWIGMTIVWVSAATRPPEHRATTDRSGGALAAVRAVNDMEDLPG